MTFFTKSYIKIKKKKKIFDDEIYDDYQNKTKTLERKTHNKRRMRWMQKVSNTEKKMETLVDDLIRAEKMRIGEEMFMIPGNIGFILSVKILTSF